MIFENTRTGTPPAGEGRQKLSTNGRCLEPLSRDTGRQFSCVVLCLACYTFPILGGRVQAEYRTAVGQLLQFRVAVFLKCIDI